MAFTANNDINILQASDAPVVGAGAGNDGDLVALERRIEADLKSALLIQTRAHLVNPKTIERSEGKAKRIIDRRAVPTSA